MAKQFSELAKKASDYAGTAANTGIALATAGIEQLTTVAVYRCPCVSPSQLQCNLTQVGSAQCAHSLNFGYGLSFIIAPAIGLYIFGIMANPKLWKLLTGCNLKKAIARAKCNSLWTFMEVAALAVISPITWVVIALLDGRFLACATTPLPYDVTSGTSFASCEAVAIAKIVYTSDAFNDNRSFSQLLGWIVLAACLVLAIFAYGYMQCSSPLTYYHAKYYRLYRSNEEAEFDDEMKKKAQVDAEANVLKFMEERRNKEQWDRISTVYEFHRDKENLALYSHLHQWVLEEEDREKKEEEERRMLLEGKSEGEGGGEAGRGDEVETNFEPNGLPPVATTSV